MRKHYFVSCLVLLLLVLSGCQSSTTSPQLRAAFLDVGQGDSILITTPQGKNILVDGGPDNAVLNKLGQRLPFWQKNLDVVVLTHPHADHVGGLPEVLRRYQVKEVWLYPSVHTAASYLEFLKLIKEQKIKTKQLAADQEIELEPQVKITVLWPTADLDQSKFNDLNSQSAVLKLVYQQSSLLLMGDAPQSVEAELLAKYGSGLSAQVLKVGHHGSKYSSSKEFLAAVRPEWAIISAGQDNDFGHPHFRALYNLQQIKTKVLRTDLNGDIILISDGSKVWSK